MSQSKRTFRDPETGEEIESTGLARGMAGLIGALIGGLLGGLLGGLTGVVLGQDVVGLIVGGMAGLVAGVIIGLLAGLMSAQDDYFVSPEEGPFIEKSGLVGCFIGWIAGPVQLFTYGAHDRIARRQHKRRRQLLQRKLAEEEWAGVPDRAFSRAQRWKNPQPTEVSLSQAEETKEGKPRLKMGVNAEAGGEEQTAIRTEG